jgi:hypothetical protein
VCRSENRAFGKKQKEKKERRRSSSSFSFFFYMGECVELKLMVKKTRCHKHTGGSINRLQVVVVMSNQQTSASQRCKRREKKMQKEEYVAMSSAQAVLLTVVFACWQLNCVEQLPTVRPDIEKTSTSPVSLPYLDGDTNRERKRERERGGKNETQIRREKHIDIVCCC